MHVRTGLEDNIFQDRARRFMATNEDLVKGIVQVSNLFERPIATPDQMRQMMGMRSGKDAAKTNPRIVTGLQRHTTQEIYA